MQKSLVDLLAASVDQDPQREALVYLGRRVSYGDLWKAVLAIASYLKKKGINKGERVALLMENSPEYVAAYYGILAAGAVVVALNNAAKADDLLHWIKHSRAEWLIADKEHAELPFIQNECNGKFNILLASLDHAKKFGFEDDACLTAESDKNCLRENVEKDELAAIIYTSGTTGNPKGVMLTHGNLSANILSILDYLDLTQNDRILNVLPFYYSYGNSVLHTHLAVGGCLVLQNSLAFPRQVIQIMTDEKITGFSGVASTYALLMNRVHLSEYDLSSLKYVTQAGGKMPPAHIKKVTEELPEVDFVVMYGQTEATARIAYLPAEKLEQKLGSAGIPIPGVEVEIRDEQGNVVAHNETGEIYVRGENLMKGYWENQEATDQVIIDGWLKTGDLAYRDEEGYLFIQGRNSEMIKVGANRISPQEIEEAISELDDVAEVAVIGVPDEILGEVIKAVIVPCEGSKLESRAVQAHCRNRLAIYKLPKFVEFVEEIPKTASGKIQRFLLAEKS